MELREGCSTKIKVCGVLPPYNACGDCAQKNGGPPSQTFEDADLVATACLKQPASKGKRALLPKSVLLPNLALLPLRSVQIGLS